MDSRLVPVSSTTKVCDHARCSGCCYQRGRLPHSHSPEWPRIDSMTAHARRRGSVRWIIPLQRWWYRPHTNDYISFFAAYFFLYRFRASQLRIVFNFFCSCSAHVRCFITTRPAAIYSCSSRTARASVAEALEPGRLDAQLALAQPLCLGLLGGSANSSMPHRQQAVSNSATDSLNNSYIQICIIF